MKKIFYALAMAPLLLANDGGCDGDTSAADRAESASTAKITAEATRSVGMPAVTNFYEKRLLKEIYERRDQANLGTYAYVQGMDGRLTCLGKALGYGVPYSTQFSNPERLVGNIYQGGAPTMPQPEPNGLFNAEGQSATWLQLVGPKGEVQVVYIEPNLVVSPFRLSGPALAADCPA